MGNFSFSMSKKTFNVKVSTGKAKGAGTNANVTITLIDELNNSHSQALDKWFHNDFEYGTEDTYTVKAPKDFGKIHSIKVHKDDAGYASDWFVEHISVEHDEDGEVHFPLCRWIPSNETMHFLKYDSSLPAECKAYSETLYQQRQDEIKRKQESFAYTTIKGIEGMPRSVKEIPPEEAFSKNYFGEVLVTKLTNKLESFIKDTRYDDDFESFEDMLKIYFGVSNPFKVPKGHSSWRSDEKFAFLRLAGPNPSVIRGCKKNGGLPSNFAVEKELVAKQFFEGKTFEDALNEDRLFYCDYQDLEEYTVEKTGMPMVCPFALFYSRMDGVLIPIAIQIYQKPSETNPVFYPPPIDDERVWLLAKFWFGVADSNYHEPVSHLLNTHLVAGDFITCFHHTVSPSHPIYKLMLPHFIYLLSINTRGLPVLADANGAFENILILGGGNCDKLMHKKYQQWNLSEMGWLHTEISNRGVENLPNYCYYKDSALIFDAIHEYIDSCVKSIYGDDDNKLKEDVELNNFAALLCDPKVGMKGVWGNGKFDKIDDLSKTLTSLVFILSNVHAAVNFNQYEEYGFPPNMPFRLNDTPPTSKASVSEEYLVSLFKADITLATLELGRTLSLQGTNKIGDYEVQYQFKPQCCDSYERFIKKLESISKINDERNNKRRFPYPWLSPKIIPNSISI